MSQNEIMRYVDSLLIRYPRLTEVRDDIIKGYLVIEKCYRDRGRLLVAGNGGSAADAGHIVGELMKSFRMKRSISDSFAGKLIRVDPERGKILAGKLEWPLEAISLAAHGSLLTAYANDVDGEGMFAQQLLGYGRTGDVFLGISTSGNSRSILDAAVVARALEMKVVGLTGADGGELGQVADVAVRVPETETYMVQELHLPVYHCWCMMLEEKFFGGRRSNGSEHCDNL